jgi:hypothetical protein
VAEILVMRMTLSEYLASLARRRWQPGKLDCGVFLADWLVACGHPDPIADVRGSYDSERGFLRVLRREGGFLAACAARLARIGAVETDRLTAGDIAVVMSPYAMESGRILRRPVGAIAVSETSCAVITSDLGVVIAGEAELPLVRSWTLVNVCRVPRHVPWPSRN